jgi:hypothetical protein
LSISLSLVIGMVLSVSLTRASLHRRLCSLFCCWALTIVSSLTLQLSADTGYIGAGAMNSTFVSSLPIMSPPYRLLMYCGSAAAAILTSPSHNCQVSLIHFFKIMLGNRRDGRSPFQAHLPRIACYILMLKVIILKK